MTFNVFFILKNCYTKNLKTVHSSFSEVIELAHVVEIEPYIYIYMYVKLHTLVYIFEIAGLELYFNTTKKSHQYA